MPIRIFIYLKEMFPPLHILGTYIFTIVMASAVCINADDIGFLKNKDVLIAAGAIVLMALMVRIMDEFKDYEDDLKNFPDRPLPSGRVKKIDLKVLQTFVIGGFLALSLGDRQVFIAALICLGYGLLMFKWFFIEEKMRKSLPLALVTHNPVILFYFGYISTVLYKQGYVSDFKQLLIGIPLMLTMTNWEISRKLRSPEEETEYTTYSKIWGPKKAGSVAIFIQIIILIGINLYLISNSAHIGTIATYNILSLYLLAQYVVYVKTLKHKLHFKVYAELLTLVAQVTVLFASLSGKLL